jgi:protein TonB
MLAYAAHRRPRRQLSPTALALIIGGHAFAIVLVASTKMDLPSLTKARPTEVIDIAIPPEPQPTPPPPKPQERSETRPQPTPDSFIDQPPRVLPLPPTGPVVDFGSATNSSLPNIGTAIETPIQQTIEAPPLLPPAAPVRVAARAVTPPDLLRPPYPDSKQRSEEEAVLRLRLAIDARGRVTSVEPVGQADPAFLAAARSHLIRHWRYRPATEDGRAVASSMTITLRFELED